MNNKRILSLVLALVMVLGTVGGVFAADTSVVNTTSQFLKKTGVLQGNDKGDLMLNSGLLRRDSVILLSRLLGVESEAKNFGEISTWEDVDKLPKLYGSYLGWGQSNGYFIGKGSGTFGPNESLKAPEYAIVLLRALEYDVQGDSWKDTLELADKLGLLEDLDLTFETIITRGQMSIMTYNALGTAINGEKETLAERLKIELPKIEKPEDEKAKELKVVGVSTENLLEVVVELTNAKVEDKDLEKLEHANNYRIDGFKVEKATKEDNKVTLVLNKALAKNKSYELVVRNILRDVNGTYKFVAEDNVAPKVEKVTVLGEYGIKITVSEPIKGLSERDFLVDGKNISMAVESYGRDIIVTPYHNEKFAENVAKLTVKSLEDYAGFKSVEQDFDIKMVEDKEAPKVVKAVLKGNVVEVEFDKDIYKESVSAYENRREEGNISFEDGRINEFAKSAVKIDTNKVRYTFDRELPRRARVVLSGVTNHSKVVMETVTLDLEESYDLTEPEIIDEKIELDVEERTATITLEFDREVDGRFEADLADGFEIDHHVSLFEREISRRDEVLGHIKSVKYGKNKAFVVIELEDLNVNNDKGDYDYIVEVRNFTDISTLRNRMYADYIEFELVTEDSKFSIEDIHVVENRYSTDIRIDFNNSVDLNALLNEDNYLFKEKANGKVKDVRELDGNIYLENRGKTVVIELPDFKVADYETLLVMQTIKDIDNTRLGRNYTYTFATGSIDNGQYTVTVASDNKRIVTPNVGVNKITLNSGLETDFVINGNLDELVINTPNADVTVAEGVTVVNTKIINIAKDSLVILGTVENIVVATNKEFSISGNVENIKITTTLAKTNVKVRVGLEGEFTVVEIVKGTEKDLGTELGIDKIVAVEITAGEGVVFELINDKDELVVEREGKFILVVGNKYTIKADGFEDKEITVLDGKDIVVELVAETVIHLVTVTISNEDITDFTVMDEDGVYTANDEGQYELIVGKTYRVVSDGYVAEFTVKAEDTEIEVTLVAVVVEIETVEVEITEANSVVFTIVDADGEEVDVNSEGKYDLVEGGVYTVKAAGYVDQVLEFVVVEGEVEPVVVTLEEIVVETVVETVEVEITEINSVKFEVFNVEGEEVFANEEGKFDLVEGEVYTIKADGYEAQEYKVVVVLDVPTVKEVTLEATVEVDVTEANSVAFQVFNAAGLEIEANEEGKYNLVEGGVYTVKAAGYVDQVLEDLVVEEGVATPIVVTLVEE